MTREQAEALARARFGIIAGLKASGVVLMLIGLWVWYGDLLDVGGNPLAGGLAFALGFFESLLLPPILVRRWRTPKP